MNWEAAIAFFKTSQRLLHKSDTEWLVRRPNAAVLIYKGALLLHCLFYLFLPTSY